MLNQQFVLQLRGGLADGINARPAVVRAINEES
jgi:hypothetical protein